MHQSLVPAMTSPDDSFKSLSLDYLNLLINGQAFSDVSFSVDGRIVHAHRCVLAARSLFFRKFFCGVDPLPSGLPLESHHQHHQQHGHHPHSIQNTSKGENSELVIPVNSVRYEVFVLMLQFLYSGQASVVAPKHEPLPGCGERGCWHTHCTGAVDLALDTLAAARSFGVEQLVAVVQKQLEGMVKEASIDDVMKVLVASRKHELQELWTTCSHLVARSGLSTEVLAKHLPIEIVAKIEELRVKSPLACRSPFMTHHYLPIDVSSSSASDRDHKLRRMRRALDSSDIELVKLMVMGEGLNLDDALAVHYAVQNCSREVVKALLELGAADVNCRAGPSGKTPLHLAAEMVSPDMVSVLLDHHADPNARTLDGITPLDVLRNLTSDFLFKGAVPGLTHIEPNKLRLCLELVQSAVMVMSREDSGPDGDGGSDVGNDMTNSVAFRAGQNDSTRGEAEDSLVSLSMNSRMVYHNLGIPGFKNDEGSKSNNANRREALRRIAPSSVYFPHGFP
ncbi:Ankyrin repeat family protein / BTB/POZ domain-containing protein [Rhynchospora pubera]|uniref:Ankyrin repeat family protein / BTB/POZ domain-containing protein n=1 Tax=Rhynchospora pubera TaxID=906938 RepID=A0AAV8EN66_9POAL|nr:Ankyrin repeat family protein / BTB/POZ domain-containing protein [Rhynchospora pubera]